VALVQQREAFIDVGRKSGECTQEADADEQVPARVLDDRVFGRDRQEEAQQQAAGKVDDECAVGIGGPQSVYDPTINQVA